MEKISFNIIYRKIINFIIKIRFKIKKRTIYKKYLKNMKVLENNFIKKFK